MDRLLDLPVTVRTLRAFEAFLRKKEWGKWLVDEPLEFLRGHQEIEDTWCLISVGTIVPIEVLPASAAY